MNDRSIARGLAVVTLVASTLAGLAGCSASKMMSKAQPVTSSVEAPKKEYQWQDMSLGKSFQGRPRTTQSPQ